MDSKLTFFFGALRFDALGFLLCLSVAAIILWDWYATYRRTGWKIDFWQFQILVSFFVPVLFMYPFSASDLQGASVGRAWPDVEKKVDLALWITLFGFASMMMGRIFFDRFGPTVSSRIVRRMFGVLESETYRNIQSGAPIILLLVLIPALFAAVLYVAPISALLKVRAYFLENNSFRSIYNLLVSLYPLLPFFYWLKNNDRMSLLRQFALLLMIIGSLFLGTRGPFVTVVLQIFIFSVYRRSGRISFLWATILIFLLAFIAMAIDAVRNNIPIAAQVLAFGANMLFGNNISDLRDFAWTLTNWDGEWFFGKTYLAAIMGFIPRSLSEFRDQWALGVITAKLAGFSPQEHAGVRPGLFGESYFNFGLVGVWVVAFINGFLLRYADYEIKRRIQARHDLVHAYVATIPFLISFAFLQTSAFWSVYVFIVLQMMASLIRHSVRVQRQGRLAAE